MQLQLNGERYRCVPDGWEKIFERELLNEYKRLLTSPTQDNPYLPSFDEICVQMDVFLYECVGFHEFDDPAFYHNLSSMDTLHQEKFYEIAQGDYWLDLYDDVLIYMNRHHLSAYRIDYGYDGYVHLPIKEVW